MKERVGKVSSHVKGKIAPQTRQKIGLRHLDRVIRAASGKPVRVIARRYGLSYDDMLTNLQPLIAQGRIIIDRESRIHHREPDREPIVATQIPDRNRRATGLKISLPHSRIDNERTERKRRIGNNRRAWVEDVNKAWLALASGPEEWRGKHRVHLRHIKIDILPATDHYLGRSEVSPKTKTKAQNVVAVYEAVTTSEATGIRLAPRAFLPFKWPSTQIHELEGQLHNSQQHVDGHVLASNGYRVGRNGLPEDQRRGCLEHMLGDTTARELEGLPPHSCGRLWRVAYAIAYVVRQAKKRTKADMSEAIAQWEVDLRWMKSNFYVGKCDTGYDDWPTT